MGLRDNTFALKPKVDAMNCRFLKKNAPEIVLGLLVCLPGLVALLYTLTH